MSASSRLLAALSAALPLIAACSPAPVPTLTTVQPAVSLAPSPDSGARLVVTMVSDIGCATFPYSCSAWLSVLPAGPGSTVPGEWRPASTDPWWGPDGDLTSSPHLATEPYGTLPSAPVGMQQIVISLLGVSDVPSYKPDGTVATDLLARCIGPVDVGPETTVVDVRVTIKPGDDPASSPHQCSVSVRVDP